MSDMKQRMKDIWQAQEDELAALVSPVKKYKFWVYDVWGNAEDGYTVNNRMECNPVIEISDPEDDEEILTALEENNLINRECTEITFSVDNSASDDETIEIVTGEDEKPFGQLVWDGEEPKDIGTFISEDVLDIEREQYQSGNGHWVTKRYTIVTGTGGPHVEFTTDYSINVYWGGDREEFTTYNDDARSAIDQIEEYLNETSGE